MRPVNWSNPVNWNHPLNKGLYRWWLTVPHWQGGTAWRDLAKFQHGTLTDMEPATDWVGPSDRPGGWGALDFDGAEHIATTGISTGGTFTLTHWANFVENNLSGYILDSQTGRFILAYDESGTPNELQFFDGAWTSFGAISYGDWQHYIWAFDGAASEAKLFVNGIQFGSTQIYSSTTLGGATNLMARNGVTAGTYGTGLLDDFRIYDDRALTPTEAKELHHLSSTFYPGLLNRRGRRAVVAEVVGNAMPMAMNHYRRMRVA